MKHNWFADDFDYRCNNDFNPELMDNIGALSSLPEHIRDLAESPDWFVILGDYVDPDLMADHFDPETNTFDLEPDELRRVCTLRNVPIRTIKKRNPEFREHLLNEPIDGWEPEVEEYDEEFELDPVTPNEDDALAHAVSLDERREDHLNTVPPKQCFDLVEDLQNDFSAPLFPTLRDKRMKGYSRNLSKAIERGITSKSLYLGIQEAQKRSAVSPAQIRRLWELFELQMKLNDPQGYRGLIARRKARAKK